jgi:hypothetical protein
MADELILEDVVAKAPDQLEENETVKGVLEVKEEKKVEPEYRFTPKKEDKKPDDEDEEEVDPEDKKLIGKMVEKGLKPLKDQLQSQSQTTQELMDKAEVDSFIGSKPEAKQYREKMLTYMKAEHYNALPAHAIFKIVAGDDLEKIGAEKERTAREKAEETYTPGNSVRQPSPTGKDWSKASSADIAAQKAKIFGQQI